MVIGGAGSAPHGMARGAAVPAAAGVSFGWTSLLNRGLVFVFLEQGIQSLWLDGLRWDRYAGQLCESLLAGRHVPSDGRISEGSSEEMNPWRQVPGIDLNRKSCDLDRPSARIASGVFRTPSGIGMVKGYLIASALTN